ncbi:hypothetical protein D3C72_1794910 [compost metagenome]
MLYLVAIFANWVVAITRIGTEVAFNSELICRSSDRKLKIVTVSFYFDVTRSDIFKERNNVGVPDCRVRIVDSVTAVATTEYVSIVSVVAFK